MLLSVTYLYIFRNVMSGNSFTVVNSLKFQSNINEPILQENAYSKLFNI